MAHVREYQPHDQHALIEILRLNTPLYFAPEEEADFIFYLNQLREDYFVLEEGGLVLGAGGINYLSENRETRISWDLLHPDFHGKGFGKQLLEHRMSWIREKTPDNRIVVRTSQLAFGFYEKSGFVLTEVLENYWAPGLDLYRMEWLTK